MIKEALLMKLILEDNININITMHLYFSEYISIHKLFCINTKLAIAMHS